MEILTHHQVLLQPSSYPVAVEELDGPEDVKLARHEKLDGQLPGQRRDPMLTGPLVDFLQKLPGSLKQTRTWSETPGSHHPSVSSRM